MNQQYGYQQQLYDAQEAHRRAEYDSIVSGIAAANTSADLAQRDIADAIARGDAYAQADAQRRLTQAEAQFQQLSAGKQALDDQQPQQTYQPQQQQRQWTTMDYINSMTQLTPKERNWLIERQSALQDQTNVSRLQIAYADSQKLGIERDSDEYFDFMNERLNFGLDRGNGQQGSGRTLTSPNEQYVVGGPKVQEQYARPNKPYTPQILKVSLTKDEAAKISGLDRREYDKQAARLAEMKRQGYYRD
jgi:hypothetical protein